MVTAGMGSRSLDVSVPAWSTDRWFRPSHVAGDGPMPVAQTGVARGSIGVQNTRVLGRQRRRFKVQMGAASGFTVDVSAGGFCAELMRVFPKGTAVKGTLLVDGQEYGFSGRIAWAKQGDFRLNTRGRMGAA